MQERLTRPDCKSHTIHLMPTTFFFQYFLQPLKKTITQFYSCEEPKRKLLHHLYTIAPTLPNYRKKASASSFFQPRMHTTYALTSPIMQLNIPTQDRPCAGRRKYFRTHRAEPRATIYSEDYNAERFSFFRYAPLTRIHTYTHARPLLSLSLSRACTFLSLVAAVIAKRVYIYR